MSDTRKTTKPNVPNLRFPGFEGEWEECTIKDFGRVVTGSTPPTSDNRYYENGLRLWASPADLRGDKYISETCTKLSEKGFAKTRVIPQGATMVTCIGSTIGKMGMASCEMSTNQQINSIISNTQTDSQYLYYAIQARFHRYSQSIAVQAVPILSKSSFEQLKNYRPLLQEQQKVGSFLDLIDRRITIQNKVIEKYESLIKALYEQLIPGDRDDHAALGTLVRICKGKQLNGEFLSEDGKYYVMNGGITPSGYYDDYNTPAGTISISEGGNSCGFVQYNEKPFWSGGHCYTLLQTTDERVQYKFLYHLLKSKQDDIMALRIGSGLPNIQKKDIGRFPIPMLPLEHQKAITRLLDSVYKHIEYEQALLAELVHLKSYFLGALFI